jgi:hypothetical protein
VIVRIALTALLVLSAGAPVLGVEEEGAQTAGSATPTALPSPDEIREKEKELEERARKIQMLEQPASPEQRAELEAQRRKLEEEKRKLARLQLAAQLLELALERVEKIGDDAIHIEDYKLVGSWGETNGEAVLRERPEATAKAVKTVDKGTPVYVLADVRAEGPWLLVVTARGRDVGFTNRIFVDVEKAGQE